MIITCPRCTAQYGVDPVHFGFGARTVRCSACEWEWQTENPDDDRILNAVASPVAEAEVAAAPIGKGESEFLHVGEALAEPRREAAFLPLEEALAGEPDRAWPAAPAASFDRAEAAPGGGDGGATFDRVEKDDLVFAPDAGDAEAAAESPLLAPDTAEPEDLEAAERTAAARRRLYGIAAGAGLIGLLVVLGIVLLAKAPIMRAFPGAGAVYHLFGLAPPPLGADLDIRNVSSSREWTGGEDVLVVAGSVVNTATEPRPLPPLRIALLDGEQLEVQTTVVEPAKPVLAAGEKADFIARIAHPVSVARRMIVSFAIAH